MPSKPERRKQPRMQLGVPVRVQGHDPDGSAWEEMTTARDASAAGAAFDLGHRAALGQVLQLSLPLPKDFRRYDFTEPSYRVQALVRNVAAAATRWRVGVLFLGKQAAKNLSEHQGARVGLAGGRQVRTERRRHQRREVFLNLRLLRTDGATQEERTVAENLGRQGARVLTSLKVSKGDVLMVEELTGEFRSRAAIRNIYVGPDRIPRLNLQFLDSEIPDRLIS
jgi:PilZ domain